jgi:hypothetical protein
MFFPIFSKSIVSAELNDLETLSLANPHFRVLRFLNFRSQFIH